MDPDLIGAIEKFGTAEPDNPSQSEAIRRILRDWLIGNGYLDQNQ
jgi:hypothetical protein